jgi:hypothetical protein
MSLARACVVVVTIYGGCGGVRCGVVVGVVFRVLCAKRDLVCWVRAWCSGYAPSMFSSSHILSLHGHGWWGWQDPCSVLGMVWTVCGGLSHTGCVREVTGHPSRCVGGRCVRLPALSPCFPTAIYLKYARMCDYGCGTGLAWCGGVLTWLWGSFSVCFVRKTGFGALCAELVLQICAVYAFQ